MYDGGDYLCVLDKVELSIANYTAFRFRSQNAQTAPSILTSQSASFPSENDSYRTLLKILSPTSLTWSTVNEIKTMARIPNW